MEYYHAKDVSVSFEEAVEKVQSSLTKEGFGVLTDIDVSATLKKKLDVNFRQYRILGACNPPFAYKALQLEDKIGVMLPCNIIVQEKIDGGVEVACINPVTSMQAVNNNALKEVALTISEKLQRVISAI